ncbi:MAG TPA: hypothetical protein VK327_10320, partial [Candidatus Paceibacterota bacterium]|nr:hypothetical protein [Candidatus Paceibacterota bacterium]
MLVHTNLARFQIHHICTDDSSLSKARASDQSVGVLIRNGGFPRKSGVGKARCAKGERRIHASRVDFAQKEQKKYPGGTKRRRASDG